jgi:dynein assembly factor 1
MSGKSMSSDIFQGLPEMSLSELKRCALEQGGYETPELNDILYLHYKGYKCVSCYFELLLVVSLLRYASNHHFRLTALMHNVAYKITNEILGRKIENLNRYMRLKTLYLDSNGLEKIDNIEHLSELRCLFLNKNLIGTIENLGGLSNLVQLDLSDNKISHIQGLSVLPNLATLNLSRNYLSDGVSISHLKECSQKLTTVNLSFNQLRGQDVMMQLFGITSLVVLEMKENPVVRELSHFRKKCIVGMPNLRSLDSPIFDEERLSTEAWAVGGREAEIKAKRDWKLAQNEKNRRNLAVSTSFSLLFRCLH